MWVLQASKAVDVLHYTERAGGVVPVQKMRYEWHPERVSPFLKTVPRRMRLFFRERLQRFHKHSVVQRERVGNSPEGYYQPIRLKNGSRIYGRIVEEKEGVVWLEVEGGKVSLKKEEIVTSAP